MATQNKTEKIVTRSTSASSLITLLSTDEKTSKRSRDDLTDEDTVSGITSFDELWLKIDCALKQSNQRIENKIDNCLAKINEVEAKLATLKAECTTGLQTMSVAVDDVRCELNATNEFVGRLERSSDLIISAVPYVSNENLKCTFEKIATTIGLDKAPLVDLKRMARTPIKAGDSPAIICQFALRSERDAFYRKYLLQRNLNLSHIGFESENRIFMNENLTVLARSIRNEALKLKRLRKIHQVFTRDGVVYVKPSLTTAAVACHSVAELEKIN